ncbi:MAG: SAM-dependent methyltransferase [Phycisphaeraceae bacterium]|nr:SAM-dependent methyltransferase [Phycisphaeraceae bacterium]
MVLRRILLHRRGGFYVDVGAHHPMRFSNTYHFYQRGWRGINIDATPGSMEAFAVHRSHDVNLEIGVSAQGGDLTFYRFDEGALNGFCRERALDRDGCSRYRLESTLTVATAPLSRILDDHLPAGQEIDFLNVDVEGMDLEVLCSNDWRRYRPHIVLAEELDEAEEKPAGSPITQFMRKQGYAPCARTTSTLLFEDTHRT